MPEQVAQECSNIQSVRLRRRSSERERYSPALGRHNQRTDRGDPILFVKIVHDRRVSFRRLGMDHVRDEEEARFIEEDQMGPTSCGVFIWGQRVRFHRAIAASSRSGARRSGF